MCAPWLLLTHDSRYHQSLIENIKLLGPEVYSPVRITQSKRKDRPSLHRYEVVLFPGYLFLRFDPCVLDLRSITALSGAYGFVRFESYGMPARIRDETIQELKRQLSTQIGHYSEAFHNDGFMSEFDRSINFIVNMNSRTARIAAFKDLLRHSDLLDRLNAGPHAMVAELSNVLRGLSGFSDQDDHVS